MSQWLSITELARAVQEGRMTAVELTERALKSIEKHQNTQAIIEVARERALVRAKQMGADIKNGKVPGRLAGVPFIAKDNFLTLGGKTTAASNILRPFEAPYQATAIERLEAEGAICIAKANLDAFAHGSSTENSDFMTTKNPHDKNKVPGGSSGGSAAAVALDMAPFALGTDTGGSIRQPAAFCGVVGYKPTYGLVSRSGVVAMASSTDVVGPITRTVADAALVLDVMSGRDKLDSTTIERDHTPYTEYNGSLKGKKIGVVKEYFGKGLDLDVKEQTEAAITKIKEAGAEVAEVSLPSIDLALACYYIICPAEVSSNLSRYDGQRYGYSSKQNKDLHESYEQSRSEGFGREAKRRIMIGTYVLSSGYYDAYYKKAQTVRTKLIDEFERVFKKVDFLIGPTTPTTAFKIGEHTADPLQMYLSDIMTVAANLTGVPAISIPNTPTGGMPIGIQVMAPARRDRDLLTIANEIERIVS